VLLLLAAGQGCIWLCSGPEARLLRQAHACAACADARAPAIPAAAADASLGAGVREGGWLTAVLPQGFKGLGSRLTGCKTLVHFCPAPLAHPMLLDF
jgi:hypothetical protein